MNKAKISFLNEVVTSDSDGQEESFQSPTKVNSQQEFEKVLKEVQVDYSLINELRCNSVNEYLERAKIHEKQRNFQQAEKDLTAALGIDSKSLSALLRRAILYTTAKEYEKAEMDYASYLLIDKTNAFAYQNHGVVLQHLGR